MTKGMLEGGPDGDDKLADLEALSVHPHPITITWGNMLDI